MRVKVIIRGGLVDGVRADGDVDLEVINIDKEYEDYEALCRYENQIYADQSLKAVDFSVAHFEPDEELNRHCKYYLTRRPPMPGAIPQGAERVEDFGKRIEIPGVGPAWGSATYREPLSPEQMKNYELTAEAATGQGPVSPEEAGFPHARTMGGM